MGDYERFHDGLLAWEADDGNIIYSASALGACESELVFSRRGIQAVAPPDIMQKAFEDGKREEKKIIDTFCKEYGVGVTHKPTQWAGQITPFPGKNILINCHIDEKALTGEIVEVKLLSEGTLKTVLNPGDPLREHYMHQMCCYSKWQGERDVYWVLGLKDKQGNFVRVAEVVVLDWEEDLSAYWPKIKSKILKVEKMVAGQEEPPCSTPGKWPCYYGFMFPENERKAAARKERQEARELIEDPQLSEWIEMRLRFHQQAAVAEKAKKEYDGLIKEKLGETTVTRRYTDGRFNLTQVPFSKQVNWDGLKAFVNANGRKWEEFMIDNPGSYFKVGMVKAGEDEA